MADKNVENVDAQIVADYYGVPLKKVVSWINEGHLSGVQMEGHPDKYLVPKEEFDYLKSKRDKDTTEKELKKLLGALDDWEFEIEE
jgi:excisionase family DNA binding protein